MAAVRKWTAAEIKALKKTWPNGTPAEVHLAVFDASGRIEIRKWDCVKKKASRLCLKKTKKYMRTLGRKV